MQSVTLLLLPLTTDRLHSHPLHRRDPNASPRERIRLLPSPRPLTVVHPSSRPDGREYAYEPIDHACSQNQSRLRKPPSNILLPSSASLTCNGQIDEHLNKTGGLFAGPVGGNFTSADYMMIFPLEALSSSEDFSAGNRKHILRFLDHVHSRPAYKRALEKGGEYAYAKAKL